MEEESESEFSEFPNLCQLFPLLPKDVILVELTQNPNTANVITKLLQYHNDIEVESIYNNLLEISYLFDTTYVDFNVLKDMLRVMPSHLNKLHVAIDYILGNKAEMRDLVFGRTNGLTSLSKIGHEKPINGLSARSMRLYRRLMDCFPDISRTFLKSLIVNQPSSSNLLEDLTNLLTTIDYPKSPKQKAQTDNLCKMKDTVKTTLDNLKILLPNADPQFLSAQSSILKNLDEVNQFVNNALEKGNYPKLVVDSKRKAILPQIARYTSKFNAAHFCQIIPHPDAYFDCIAFSGEALITNHFKEVLAFLRNHFFRISAVKIRNVMMEKRKFFCIFDELQQLNNSPMDCGGKIRTRASVCTKIPLLQLFAYAKHEKAILDIIAGKSGPSSRATAAKKEYDFCFYCLESQKVGWTKIACKNGCIFCQVCIQKNIKKSTGDNFEFTCLISCGAVFHCDDLREHVPLKLLSELDKSKQLEEVMAAHIEGLELCPFCRFATIPAAEDRIFKCPNEECLRESCRLCRKAAHVPLRCEEVGSNAANIKKLISNNNDENKTATCNCCYMEGIPWWEIVNCPSGCTFCRDCVFKSVEVNFAENKVKFPCLKDCGNFFNLDILQGILPLNLFSNIAQETQLEEVKAAHIEGLKFCPFCQFAMVPPEEETTFKCLNENCRKETCILCSELAHEPLRCDQVEKDEDTKRRTFIENKMTEGLLRECPNCHKKFIKSDGCNKITCACGTMMCYLCKATVLNYDHFNGQGSTYPNRCPLYSNTELLHEEAAIRSGQAAKNSLGNVVLPIDPLEDADERLNLAKSRPNLYQ